MARRMTRAAFAAALALAPVALVGNVGTYTETFDPDITVQSVLGYPVPEPVDTPTAGSYFRTYNGLRARWTNLLLSSSNVTESAIGTTLNGRTIYGYALTDGDGLAVDGTREPGVLVSGTLHSREWVSPEILTQTAEHLLDGYGTDPIATYLIDQNRLVFVPVSNIDGFLQTQQYFNKYWDAGANGQRDGRMRRKNMLSTDTDIATGGDNLLGVDLNRNFSVGFGGGSGSPSSITYRGPSALSEPESQALANAVSLFESPGQMRCFLDMHGAIPLIYYIHINNASVDPVTTTLYQRMQSAFRAINGVSNSYQGQLLLPSGAIGAADEYFGNTYGIPSFTIEYPVPNYRTGGPVPNVFINPDVEVDEIVEENLQALLLAMMFASGPPILERVVVWEDLNSNNAIDGGEVVLDREWNPVGSPATTRALQTATVAPLIVGRTYRVLLTFNKPMRAPGPGGAPVHWPGQSNPLHPAAQVTVTLPDTSTIIVPLSAVGDGWLANTSGAPASMRYARDTWQGTLDLSSSAIADAASQSVDLRVTAVDLYGHALDAKPATVADWDLGWNGYEDAAGQGSIGGTDSSFTLDIAPETSTRDWWVFR